MITLYEKNTTTFTGNGLCGLSPVSCVVSEVAGGSYELNLQHPMDTNGKFLLLTEERLIKAPVPKTVIPQTELPALYSWKTNKSTYLFSAIPQISYDKTTWDTLNAIYVDFSQNGTSSQYYWNSSTTYAQGDYVVYLSREWPSTDGIYSIYKSINGNNRSNIPDAENGYYYWEYVITTKIFGRQLQAVADLIIDTLADETTLYKIADIGSNAYGNYSRIKTNQNVIGVVLSDDIEIDQGHESQYVPEQTITEQVFRIYSVSGDDISQMVTVQARHLSYDFMQNSLLDCVLDDAYPQEAIAEIQSSLLDTDLRGIATNINNVKVSQNWSFKNPVSALLDPSTGLVSLIGAKLFRNNTEFYLFANTAQPGITIAYGANMTGVKWDKSIDGVYTRVIPRSGSNGNYIYIYNGGRISNGVVQDQDKIYVESANADNYAIPRNYVLNSQYQVGQTYKKPNGSTGTYTEVEVQSLMRTEAANMFLIDGVDKPKLTLDVQFLLLGDTEEYKQYKDLQTVSMYDTITIKTGKSGLTVSAQVIEYEYDSINRRYNRIKLGTVNLIKQRTPGYRLMRESITMDKLAPDVINKLYGGT